MLLIRSSICRVLLVACLALTFVVHPAHAQQDADRLSVSLSTHRVELGTPANLVIEYRGTADVRLLNIPDDPWMIVGTPRTLQRSSTEVINGRVRRNDITSLTYQLIPVKAGRYEIGPLNIEADGQTITTDPLLLEAVEPSRTGRIASARLTLEEVSAYVGQPVLATIQIDLPPRTRLRDLGVVWPEVHQSINVSPVANPRGTTTAGGPRMLLGIPATVQQFGDIDTGITFRMQVALTPGEPGTFDIGPARPLLLYSQNFAEVLVTQATRLEVMPMPTPPDEFSGLVGRYSVSMNAEPREVRVGDPISLRLRITGEGLTTPIDDPALDNNPRFTERFQVTREEAPGSNAGGSAAFEYLLRATSSDVTEIPDFDLVYFDPEQGQYARARAPAIPITVEATPVVTVDDALSNTNTTSPEARDSLVRFVARHDRLLSNQRFVLAEQFRRSEVIAAIAAPPAVFLGAIAFVAVRRRSTPAFRALTPTKAHARARQRLAGAATGNTDASGVSAAVQTYIGARLGRDPAAITAEECVRDIRERCNEQLARETRELLEQCDAVRFGGSQTADSHSLRDRADDLLKRLAREDRA